MGRNMAQGSTGFQHGQSSQCSYPIILATDTYCPTLQVAIDIKRWPNLLILMGPAI